MTTERKPTITVAIGDIHGMHDQLCRLLQKTEEFLRRNRSIRNSRYIFLGDYIDRGPDSRSVVRLLRSLQERRSVVCLKGNHEDLMSRFHLNEENNQTFFLNGGRNTLASYEGHQEEFEADKKWMSNLPTSFEDEMRIFVHAGLQPGVSMERQSDHAKLWIRDRFLEFKGDFSKYVVHGHTPARCENGEDKPIVYKNRCNIDTGAVFGGRLTAALFNEKDVEPFKFISVE